VEALYRPTSGDAGDEGDAGETPVNGGNALEVGDAMQSLISSAPATPVVVNCRRGKSETCLSN